MNTDKSIAAEMFRKRLILCLQDRGVGTDPAVLVREFNLRAESHTITIHAARKWLVGDAVPTQQRIVVLAKWLGVSPHWLAYGPDHLEVAPDSTCHTTSADETFLSSLNKLDGDEKEVIRKVISILLTRQLGESRTGEKSRGSVHG